MAISISAWLSYPWLSCLESAHTLVVQLPEMWGGLHPEFRAPHFWLFTSWDPALILEAMKTGNSASVVSFFFFFVSFFQALISFQILPALGCSPVSSGSWDFLFCFELEFIVAICGRFSVLRPYLAILSYFGAFHFSHVLAELELEKLALLQLWAATLVSYSLTWLLYTSSP